MSDFGFDFSEANKLAADLTMLTDIITAEARTSVQQTAIETKKFYAADAKSSFGSLGGRYGPTIDYDIEGVGRGHGISGGTITANIGPNLARYGGKTGPGGLMPSMGILEEGGGGVLSSPKQSVRRAEKFAQDEFPKRLDIAVEKSQKQVGL